MLQKFASRKLLAGIAGFIAVNVIPNIPDDTRAKYSGAIAAVYILAQAFADAFGSGAEPSQGATTRRKRVRKAKPQRELFEDR